MHEGLESLFLLQEKDDQLKEIQQTIKEIPHQILDLEQERDAKAEMIEKAKSLLTVNIEARKKLEKEIVAVRVKIAHYREQMKKVTTNKEYQGFISEIKFEESQIQGVEEKIIEKMIESDEIMEKIRRTEMEFLSISGEYNKKIGDLRHLLEYNKQKLQEETKTRQQLRTKIPQELLRVYDNLFPKKTGKVVSLVETKFCGICNIKIRPQLFSELITSKDIQVCENCGRILFKKINEEPNV